MDGTTVGNSCGCCTAHNGTPGTPVPEGARVRSNNQIF